MGQTMATHPRRGNGVLTYVGRGISISVLAWFGLLVMALGVRLVNDATSMTTFCERLHMKAHRQSQTYTSSVVALKVPEAWRQKTIDGSVWASRFWHALWDKTQRMTPSGAVKSAVRTPDRLPWLDTLSVAKTLAQVVWFRWLRLWCGLPVLGLLAIVAVSDGWVQRALRRWRGARESALLFHQLKRGWFALSGVGLFVYLVNPSVSSDEIVLWPTVAVLAVGTAATLAQFKKYV
jgi:hypothetical protein